MLTFEEILAGAAGAQEATAAQRWLDAGAPVQPLAAGLVALDPRGFDMRVAGTMAGKWHRTAAGLPASPGVVGGAVAAHFPVLFPAAVMLRLLVPDARTLPPLMQPSLCP